MNKCRCGHDFDDHIWDEDENSDIIAEECNECDCIAFVPVEEEKKDAEERSNRKDAQ